MMDKIFPCLLGLALSLGALEAYTTNENDFNVYWNVPTFMCDNRGIYINASKFGVIQNTNDEFKGDKVVIWYNPGKFPHLSSNESIDGGIPQLGDLDNHKETFRAQVEETLSPDFNGLAVLDFEYYLPGYARAPQEYRKASNDWVASLHPGWSDDEIHAEAAKTFNESSRLFMESLLEIGVEMRPNALWGYYHYPYCKNHNGVLDCPVNIADLNDKTLWIYEKGTATYPSIYLIYTDDVEGRKNMVLGRIREAQRLNEMLEEKMKILTYCTHMYHSMYEFITEEDIINSIGMSKAEGLDGSVMWGGSGDLNTEEKCNDLKNYLDNTLGPLIELILETPVPYLRDVLQSPKLMQQFISMALSKPF